MRRMVIALLAAAQLLGVGLAVVPAAAATGSQFTGMWRSIDTDGSTQVLIVSSGVTPAVTYQDFYASVCANNGFPTVHWAANGAGTVSGDVLDVVFHSSGCGRFSIGAYESVWVYQPATDTLGDPYGVTWYRAP